MNDPQKKYRLGTVSKNILLEGFNQFYGTNLTLNSDVDQNTFGKVAKHNKLDSQEVLLLEGLKTGFTAPASPLIQMWIKTHRYLVCMKDP